MTLTQLRDSTRVLLEYPNLSLPNPAEFCAFLRECEEDLDCDHLITPIEEVPLADWVNEAIAGLAITNLLLEPWGTSQ